MEGNEVAYRKGFVMTSSLVRGNMCGTLSSDVDVHADLSAPEFGLAGLLHGAVFTSEHVQFLA